jgi:hypothetical protein
MSTYNRLNVPGHGSLNVELVAATEPDDLPTNVFAITLAEVDAWHESTGTIIEVEAGRAVINHQFLKDFFEACVIQDAQYLVIAVCKAYKPASFKNPVNDFEIVTTFMDTLYSSGRLVVPLKGILVIGY